MDELHGPLGILGGGQLGRMLCLAAHRLGVQTVVVDPLGPDSPAGAVTRGVVTGHFRDAETLEQLAGRCKVITYEIEHINAEALESIAKANPALRMEPAPATIQLIQDKLRQKEFLRGVGGVPMGDFRIVNDEEDVERAGADWGYPLMLKARRLAYDGRGNAVVRNASESRTAVAALRGSGASQTELYVERWVPFERELAVMVARSSTGEVAVYPVVRTVQKDSQCHTTITPACAGLPEAVNWSKVEAEAQRIASNVVKAFAGAGMFGVELFMTPSGEVLFNEVAPRVHNSGHYTMDCCATDQFEQHVRAVLGLPLGSPELLVPAAGMLNVIGGLKPTPAEAMAEALGPIQRSLSVPRTAVHWYGKREAKAKRKMGHINVTGNSVAEVLALMAQLDTGDVPEAAKASPLVGVIMGSDSDLPTMKAAAEVRGAGRRGAGGGSSTRSRERGWAQVCGCRAVARRSCATLACPRR